MDATTARLSHSIGMNVQGMSLWQGIVRQFGGTAQDALTPRASAGRPENERSAATRLREPTERSPAGRY